MPKKAILVTLQTYSSTGGIQKMTRTLAHSLFNIAKQNDWDFSMWSLYDSRYDLMDQYLPAEKFSGFGNKRLKFAVKALKTASQVDTVILSHVNLSLIGIIIKLINPKCKVWLIAHGIEVWRPLNFSKRSFLMRYCDKIVSVSQFTNQQMIDLHGANPKKCFVLNNAIDPFIKLPFKFSKPEYLLTRYSVSPTDPVIFTLTRLASSEQYKGYDQVIKSVSHLKQKFPNIKYILSGPYDLAEEKRIRQLIKLYELNDHVILTGFLIESELADHFLLADLFVLPSKKEGFGIVFVEALACGLPVICGNADGSVDAIRNGELGTAVNVDDLGELEEIISQYLRKPLTLDQRLMLQKQSLRSFDERVYRKKLQQLINNEFAN
jgi:phosphatidyl-myo-inositol dimannoside synthase